jgi:hypothetical protein
MLEDISVTNVRRTRDSPEAQCETITINASEKNILGDYEGHRKSVCAQQYSGVDFWAFKDLVQQMFLDMYINTSYTLGGCVRSISLENA